ncbi:hypothetical protein SDC9_107834 [bioreactor metagenome]|uniref:Uncharacterized protein n=1 Tax=bioreactor metagenome TaxID=1076179 RepID=A0A645B6B6_9ZZZZ
MIAFVPGWAASQPRTVSSRSGVKPVVPTTQCTPCEMAHSRLPITTSGTVKSTTTSAAATGPRSSPWSTVAPSTRSGAASTAATTSRPIRPLAPNTATVVIICSSVIRCRQSSSAIISRRRSLPGVTPRSLPIRHPPGQVRWQAGQVADAVTYRARSGLNRRSGPAAAPV